MKSEIRAFFKLLLVINDIWDTSMTQLVLQ